VPTDSRIIRSDEGLHRTLRSKHHEREGVHSLMSFGSEAMDSRQPRSTIHSLGWLGWLGFLRGHHPNISILVSIKRSLN